MKGWGWVQPGFSQTQTPSWVPGLLYRDGNESSELRFRTNVLQPGWRGNWVSQIPWCVKLQTQTCSIFFSGGSCQSHFLPYQRAKQRAVMIGILPLVKTISRESQERLILHVDWVNVGGRAQTRSPEEPNFNPATRSWCDPVTWESHLISLGIHSLLVQWVRQIK